MFKLQLFVFFQNPDYKISNLILTSFKTSAQYLSTKSSSHPRVTSSFTTTSVTSPGRRNRYERRSRLKMSQKKLELISVVDSTSTTDSVSGRLLKWAIVGVVASAIGYWCLRQTR
jgi:hypothetical protein